MINETYNKGSIICTSDTKILVGKLEDFKELFNSFLDKNDFILENFPLSNYRFLNRKFLIELANNMA